MPPTILELKQRRQAILDELKALQKAAELTNRTFTDDERTKIASLKTENEEFKAKIAKAEADEQTASFIGDLDRELSQTTGRVTAPDDISRTRIEPVPPPKFKSLGEQLLSIAHAGIHGDHPHGRDNRLVWESLAPATGGATATTPSDGGYLIQKDFASELITRMSEFGQIKNRVRTIPISANSDGLKIHAVDETSRAGGSRWGGVQVYWGAEADAATAKKPKFRQLSLELHDLIGLAYMTDRLLRDASAVGAIFQTAFTEEMAFMCEDAIINGLGAGQPLGITQCNALVSVSKETGQAAATIVFENIQKMWSRLWGRSRANAVWLINQDCEPQLNSMAISVGTGGLPVYLQPGGLSESPYATLMGRPVIPVEYCATVGTVGDILLVDFSQVLAIEKDGMQSDSSIHVRFTTNETAFRFIYRYDAQPVWNAALNPFKGSNTQSPYVALSTRA